MSTNKRINILVYTGEGTTTTSIQHTLFSLRHLLSPTYIVLPFTSSALLKEPWQGTCAALVIPGGADLPYCRKLNGEGNRRIKKYVQGGGRYIGLCAGGYYGTSRVEFMKGDPIMEVVGDRELQFYPGIGRGLAFKGFKYQSEAGARAASLKVHDEAFQGVSDNLPDRFRCYYNGGGVFVDAPMYEDRGVEILASYLETLDCNAGDGAAAVVYRKVGEGEVLLTGPHPEFAPANLDRDRHGPDFKVVVENIEREDDARKEFLKACLRKVGLEVNESAQPVPSPSPLYLTSLDPSDVPPLLAKWKNILVRSGDEEVLIKGDNDTFNVKNIPEELVPSESDTLDAGVASISLSSEPEAEQEPSTDRIVDYDKLVKHIIIHADQLPTSRDTPNFSHDLFYSSLEKYFGARLRRSSFGKLLLYADVVTSTSTMLEKNHSLLSTLPTGFTATASTQITGRGRGSNVWASPPGSLMFSTVIWHPSELAHSAPVVFIQYIAAMAVVRAARSYSRGYDRLPIRLKWPNDVYAGETEQLAKVAGVLVNSTYSGGAYGLVVGVGVNVANAAPTVGLDSVAKGCGLAPFEKEKLLARILTTFEELYYKFCEEGWGSQMESIYYNMWLHSDQVVTIESEGGLKARIKGITRDWGLLLAEELSWDDRPTGHAVTLQSDSNSFDFFKGLVRKKI